MLTEEEAKVALLGELPDVKVEAVIFYQDVYLFRVQFSDPEEADYDSFFAVDSETGWVEDFSVMEDGDISEIAAAFANSSAP